MSTQVTVHRMVTTTTTSAVLLNIGYVKTLPGILKVFQIILSCIAIGILGHYITTYTSSREVIVPELFFLLIATACLICTSLLLFSCLCSIATASIMPRTLFEAMYHIVACLLFFAAGLCLVIYLKENEHYIYNYVAKMAAGVVMFHATLSYLLMCSSINHIWELVNRNHGYKIYERGYNSKMFCGALGLVNTALYALSSFYSIRSYRRGG
ncbi:unnamed protein product [Meganyctiphanes norvegica]|uniref:MARVEL domain-containing protein n=1 Tax=Meganyctiphanes norvegica TaxID=48144 RepID=A0AAV2RAX0_MEGNR